MSFYFLKDKCDKYPAGTIATWERKNFVSVDNYKTINLPQHCFVKIDKEKCEILRRLSMEERNVAFEKLCLMDKVESSKTFYFYESNHLFYGKFKRKLFNFKIVVEYSSGEETVSIDDVEFVENIKEKNDQYFLIVKEFPPFNRGVILRKYGNRYVEFEGTKECTDVISSDSLLKLEEKNAIFLRTLTCRQRLLECNKWKNIEKDEKDHIEINSKQNKGEEGPDAFGFVNVDKPHLTVSVNSLGFERRSSDSSPPMAYLFTSKYFDWPAGTMATFENGTFSSIDDNKVIFSLNNFKKLENKIFDILKRTSKENRVDVHKMLCQMDRLKPSDKCFVYENNKLMCARFKMLNMDSTVTVDCDATEMKVPLNNVELVENIKVETDEYFLLMQKATLFEAGTIFRKYGNRFVKYSETQEITDLKLSQQRCQTLKQEEANFLYTLPCGERLVKYEKIKRIVPNEKCFVSFDSRGIKWEIVDVNFKGSDLIVHLKNEDGELNISESSITFVQPRASNQPPSFGLKGSSETTIETSSFKNREDTGKDDEFELPQSKEYHLSLTRPFVSYVGEQRGIQGKADSCFSDTLLFALFSKNDVLDFLFKQRANEEHIADLSLDFRKVLRRKIVYPLREYGFVSFHRTQEMREVVKKFGPKFEEMIKRETDMESVANILSKLCSKEEQLISLISVTGQENYSMFMPLFVKLQNRPKFMTSQTMLDMSMVQNDVFFKEAPTCLIIQAPRDVRGTCCYENAIPSETIEISALCLRSRKKCWKDGCKENAKLICKTCCEQKGLNITKGMSCDEHKCSAHNKTAKLPQCDIEANSKIYMQLRAIICIEKGHFVAYVKHYDVEKGVRWQFFDSMSSQGISNSYAIPKVSEDQLVTDFLQKTYEEQKILCEWYDPEQLKRIVKNSFIFVYNNNAKSCY